jgi:hypothetical protein
MAITQNAGGVRRKFRKDEDMVSVRGDQLMECVSSAVTEMSEAAADAEIVRLALMRIENIFICIYFADGSRRRAFGVDPIVPATLRI